MIKIITSFLLFFFSLGFTFDATHEFHLSNSELSYKSSSAEIQLSLKIFIDDLESALAARGIEGLHIGTEKESEESIIYVGEYLSDAFKITTASDTLEAEIIGTELSADLSALWCYIKFPIESGCSQIKVTNTILTELFNDQKNILSFKTESGNKDYFTFDASDTEKIFSCE